MRRFAALFATIDTSNSTTAKVAAMAEYFREAPPADAAWAVYILSGRRLKRLLGPAVLGAWLNEESGLPTWLVEESHAAVGDLAETIALLMSGTAGDAARQSFSAASLSDWLELRLLPLRDRAADEQREVVTGWWRTLPYAESFLVNKLMTGSLRVGVSHSLVTRALAVALDRPRAEVEHSLMGEWQPSANFWLRLKNMAGSAHPSQPYPFFLASPLEGEPDSLGPREEWIAEWKWDGIRGQLIRRAGQTFLWSRGEELITARFPEIVSAGDHLPDGTVLDGEILAWGARGVLPFATLQTRIGRKALTARVLAAAPARFVAYDLLERDGLDRRADPLEQRRLALRTLLAPLPASLTLSAELPAAGWAGLHELRDRARAEGVEGLMLKRRTSVYGTGRQRGDWWKWKVMPHTFDAVMIYAHPGHGRRSSLYTDYTFGVWRAGELVPVAKAYSGLSDTEIADLDRWIRGNTIEKFGPVRAVQPTQVFELAYEGIAASSRHKSGIALRFPRIRRWRLDKPASEADTLEQLQAVLSHAPAQGSGEPSNG